MGMIGGSWYGEYYAIGVPAGPSVVANAGVMTAAVTVNSATVSSLANVVVGGVGVMRATVAMYDTPNRFIFIPPAEDLVPPVAYEVPAIWNRLMRYYKSRPRGLAIWKLVDGTYTTNQPYPNLDYKAAKDNTGPNTNAQWTYILVYLGGHEHVIDRTEKDALTAAGYGQYIKQG